MFKKSSIRVKFLLMILTMLIPLIALRANNLAEDYHKLLDIELNNYEKLAEAISTSYINYLEEIWTLEDIAGAYLKDNPQLSLEDIKTYLQLIKEKQGGIMGISWLDATGKIITTSSDEIIIASLDSRPYIKEIHAGREKVVSNLIEDFFHPGQYVIPVARAIKTNDELVGIVAATIDIDKLSKRLPDMKIRSEYRYHLIDREGTIVCCNSMNDAPYQVKSLKGNPSVQEALNGRLVKGVKEKSPLDGSWMLCVDYPISGIGWDCRITFSYDALVSTHQEFVKNEILALMLVVVLSIAMAFFFGQSLLRPIKALRSAARGIMDGDYSARTHVKGRDEISLAAEAFDKMAESVEQWYKVKNQYFTNMSHEIKTPINVIFASIQLVESYKTSELSPDQYREKVQTQVKLIRQNCYRVIRLISNLTDISRYDSGFLKIKLGNYDIVALTRDITLSVERYAEMKGVRLVFETELASRVMACDPDLIERIVLNLISNAIKFTDRGGLVTLALKEWEDRLAIEVKDTGVGIPEGKLSDIFERFKQADDPYCRNKEGSGIGLSLVKAFVEAHGGDIRVVSQPLVGSAFEIRLPIRLVEGGNENTPASLEQGQTNKSFAVNRTHIELSDIYSGYGENVS